VSERFAPTLASRFGASRARARLLSDRRASRQRRWRHVVPSTLRAMASGTRQVIWLIATFAAVLAPAVVHPPWGFLLGFALLGIVFATAPWRK
jgi:hypothetical protein